MLVKEKVGIFSKQPYGILNEDLGLRVGPSIIRPLHSYLHILKLPLGRSAPQLARHQRPGSLARNTCCLSLSLSLYIYMYIYLIYSSFHICTYTVDVFYHYCSCHCCFRVFSLLYQMCCVYTLLIYVHRVRTSMTCMMCSSEGGRWGPGFGGFGPQVP